MIEAKGMVQDFPKGRKRTRVFCHGKFDIKGSYVNLPPTVKIEKNAILDYVAKFYKAPRSKVKWGAPFNPKDFEVK